MERKLLQIYSLTFLIIAYFGILAYLYFTWDKKEKCLSTHISDEMKSTGLQVTMGIYIVIVIVTIGFIIKDWISMNKKMLPQYEPKLLSWSGLTPNES